VAAERRADQVHRPLGTLGELGGDGGGGAAAQLRIDELARAAVEAAPLGLGGRRVGQRRAVGHIGHGARPPEVLLPAEQPERAARRPEAALGLVGVAVGRSPVDLEIRVEAVFAHPRLADGRLLPRPVWAADDHLRRRLGRRGSAELLGIGRLGRVTRVLLTLLLALTLLV